MKHSIGWKTAGALAVSLMLLVGCGGEEFVIEAGEHGAGFDVALHGSAEVRFEALFDETAIYETVDPRNQADINKLYGFSDCSSHHHTNSARFGWRWFDDALQIFAYVYADGVRHYEYIGDATLGRRSSYHIGTEGAAYVFEFGGRVVYMPRGCAGDGGVKYRLYPYFGGDETAPHDIVIRIFED